MASYSASGRFEQQNELSMTVLNRLSQMGVQPKDLIDTLPRLHEKSVTPQPDLQNVSPRPSPPPPSSLPSSSLSPSSLSPSFLSPSSLPPSSLPPPSLPCDIPVAQKALQRDRGFTENGTITSDSAHHSPSETTPPPTGSAPTKSIGAKMAKKFEKRNKKRTNSHQLTDIDKYIQSFAVDTATLRRSHYLALQPAAKCTDKKCRRRFGRRDRKRNCCMCGEVFCRKCTKYMRKLSANAEPDSLGTFRNVCEKCFNVSLHAGRYRDRKEEFIALREEAKQEMKSKDVEQVTIPLPSRQRSKLKSDQIQAEVDRLVKGFETQKVLKGLVGIPKWQKSDNWVPDSTVSECYQCGKRLRIRKTNCRVCGQVFCSDCTKSEILLYVLTKECPAKWCINGKEGGPSTKPYRFETYSICKHCCSELEEILLNDIHGPTKLELPFQPSCLDEIASLQSELAALQRSVEQNLPLYQRLVDTLDIEDSSPRTVQGDHPLRNLAKAQADLSDTFSHMANRSQALKALHTATNTQAKLLHHIMVSMFNFYQEHMFLFKSAQMRLKEMMPVESLSIIQEFLDQQSMERVHVTLRQLSFELLNIEGIHKCELDFIQNLVEADAAIEDEFRPFLEKRGENWDKHLVCVRELVEDSIKKRPYIELQSNLPCGAVNYKIYVRYFTLNRTKSLLSKCVRELEAKTREEAFLETKSSLTKAGKYVSKELQKITDQLSPK